MASVTYKKTKMKGLSEIGQDIGKLFVNTMEIQSRRQCVRDNMNFLRYQRMIKEELRLLREETQTVSTNGRKNS